MLRRGYGLDYEIPSPPRGRRRAVLLAGRHGSGHFGQQPRQRASPACFQRPFDVPKHYRGAILTDPSPGPSLGNQLARTFIAGWLSFDHGRTSSQSSKPDALRLERWLGQLGNYR